MLVTCVEVFRMHLPSGACHLLSSLVASAMSASVSLAGRRPVSYRSVVATSDGLWLLRSDSKLEILET